MGEEEEGVSRWVVEEWGDGCGSTGSVNGDVVGQKGVIEAMVMEGGYCWVVEEGDDDVPLVKMHRRREIGLDQGRRN